MQLPGERGPRIRKRTVATRGAALTGKIHRFREKADSKKNISRSNSPTGDYSGVVFSFFGVSFSVHLAIHLLMFAFRSMETSTPAFYIYRIKEVYKSRRREGYRWYWRVSKCRCTVAFLQTTGVEETLKVIDEGSFLVVQPHKVRWSLRVFTTPVLIGLMICFFRTLIGSTARFSTRR